MATKQFNSRIQWKKDTSANWTSNNPVLLNGEIAIVVTNSGETRFKIGDGTSSYTALPFQDEAVRALITAVDGKIDTHIADTDNPHEVTKAQIGLSNVDNVKQYSDSNPPPYPVTSVNSKTGAVSLTASDVGALSTAGGTLTGNLTGKYITGTWLQSTADTHSTSKQNRVCVFDGSGWVYSRTLAEFASDLGIQDGVEKYSGTLPTSGWTTSGSQRYYQVSISGMTADKTILAIPQWSNQTNQQDSWNNLVNIQSYAGYVRFYASAAPSVSINYTLIYY